MHGEQGPTSYAAPGAPASAPASALANGPASASLLRGRVCVVTGANRGIGLATSVGLARLGATVVLLCRDAAQGAAARETVARAGAGVGGDATVVTANLASFASIRAAAAELQARHPAVHALVHNAGVNPPRRRTSADGIELTFAVNHLAPFLLTHRLLAALRRGAAASGDARVVTVTSVFERLGRIAFDDLQGERRFLGLVAYTQSKLANVLFTRAVAARLAGSGVAAHAAYPGLVATDLMREHAWWTPLGGLWRRVLRTPDEGARASVLAVASPALAGATGLLLDAHGRRHRGSPQSRRADTRERLWAVSAELTGAGDWTA